MTKINQPIKVLIIEDHAMVRAGIRMLLESQTGVTVVGEAGDGRDGVRKAVELSPDVALMDIAMPCMTGLEATRAMKQQCPNVKVLVLTMHEEDSYFFHALRAGAAGYILKEAPPNDLVNAIRIVHGGGVYFHPTLTARLLKDYLGLAAEGASKDSHTEKLTQREQEVLRLTAAGRTSREIGQALFVSARTAERHRTNIMDKLRLHNRAELIRYAVDRGLIEPDTV